MAATVTLEGLRELAAFRAEKGCAISLYLNLDPSVSPTAGDAQTRVNSLVDEGERGDGADPARLTHDQREALKSDFERIRRYFTDEFDREGVRGVAVFCAGLDAVWRPLPLSEPVPDAINIGREFFLAPLVPLLGRGDGAIVAFVGREQGQLFRLSGGRLQEVADHFEEQPGRHDQGGWSQARFQRHIEARVQDHLREVVDELDRRVRRFGSPRVVIVSSEETRSELDHLLPASTRNALAGWTTAEAHASPADLLEVAKPVLEQWREQHEAGLVEQWREEAGRNGRAASGWEQTLEAASDARVDVLLFQDGVSREGWQCPQCGRASAGAGSCPLDGAPLERRDNALDLAVHHALAHGGTLWAIQHHHDLEPVEGIGAILRY